MERHVGRQPAPVSRPTALVTGTHGRTTVIRLLGAALAAGGRALAAGDLIEIDPETFPVATAPAAEIAVVTRASDDTGPPQDSAESAWDQVRERRMAADWTALRAEALVALARHSERVVLNADDPLCRHGSKILDCPLTWFTLDPRNPLVIDHLGQGGDACVLDDGLLCLCAGSTREVVVPARELPLTLGGAARHQTANALAALGAAVGLGLSLDAIRSGLRHVRAGARHFRLGGCQVLVDRPRDRAGAEACLRTASELPAERRRVMLGLQGTGLDELAGLVGIEVVPAAPRELRGVLSESAPGDLLLVLLDGEERSPEPYLSDLEARGWAPGAPLPS